MSKADFLDLVYICVDAAMYEARSSPSKDDAEHLHRAKPE